MNLLKQAWGGIKSAVRRGKNLIVTAAVGGALAVGTAGQAVAQVSNDGVAEVETALNALKPDLSTIVVAALGIALIGIGAAVAVSIAKRLMTK